MLKLLLSCGGDIHRLGPTQDPHPTTLLLYYTVTLKNLESGSRERRDSVKLVKFLIKEGADVNLMDNEGYSPFFICAGSGETSVCKLLVDRGADSSVSRKDGGTALHAASQNGLVEACRYLVEECGLDINAELIYQQKWPVSPLGLAAQGGDLKVCEYLLKNGATVDAGYQPLILAVAVFKCFLSL
jgi:hypothetical protein